MQERERAHSPCSSVKLHRIVADLFFFPKYNKEDIRKEEEHAGSVVVHLPAKIR
jgi:hypothetical protein